MCVWKSFRLLLSKQFFGAGCRRHRAGPSGVKREMRDHLDEFLLRDTVLDCVRKVKAHLLGLARGDQRRTSYQAAVALRELRSLPYVTEQNVFGEVDELGRELTKRVARGWLGGHIVFLSG